MLPVKSPLVLLAESREHQVLRYERLSQTSALEYRLKAVHNLRELGEQLKAEEVNLLILNLDQFRLDRTNLTKLLALNKANIHLPVLFVTSDEQDPLLESHAESVLVDFLVEPFKAIELRSRIRTYLSVIRLQQNLRDERDELLKILQSVVPQDVVKRVIEGNIPRPTMVDDVLVMFTDFVDYTAITQRYGSQFSYEHLNSIFAAFDQIVEHFDLDCVKVIGDAYMISGGVHQPLDYLALRGVMAGLKMLAFLEAYNHRRGDGLWKVRIGMHQGPVMAGFSRTKRMAFDLWGNTVNLASRLEEFGVESAITLGQQLFDQSNGLLQTQALGERIIDNWGSMHIHQVIGLDLKACPHEMLALYEGLNVDQLLEDSPVA